ncbi:hypothetical protein MLD38_022866 [Melastoma candidum]|nr:hypothetical protein MLD38_022866 [Melastoma candidum]
MYDILYTKAPILYTRIGIIGRFLVVLSLASALSGFSAIFRNTFLIDMYIVYTYAILIAVLTYELYQTMLIPFSDWAVVKMIRLRRYRFMLRMISCVAGICIKQRRWSKTLGQLNLFKYCRQKEFPRPVSTLLWLFGKEEIAKRHWVQSRRPIPWDFMEMLHKYMKALEEKRECHPFNKRGGWTFERYSVCDNTLLSSIAQGFDKSIITWHIATEICLNQLNDEEGRKTEYRCVKIISDYMMYLVALRPQLLSLTTTDVTMGYAYGKLSGFLRYRTDQRAFKDLSAEGPLPSMEINNEAQELQETFITKDWDVLSEARKLAKALQRMPCFKKWDVMGSIWVEMLCFAAYNCQVYHHAKMLRCGGELITHIWLILLHKTDKYEITNIKVDELRGSTSKPIKSPKNTEHPCIKFFCR